MEQFAMANAGSTVGLVIDTSRQGSYRHPDAGSERSSSISSSSTTHYTPSSFHIPSPASNASAPDTDTCESATKTEGLMWQIEEYLSHFGMGRTTSKTRRPAKRRIEVHPETIEQALASSPDALRFSTSDSGGRPACSPEEIEGDLLSPFCFKLQGERVLEDVAPFPYSPGGEGDADCLERQLLSRRLDSDIQDENVPDDGTRERFESFCCSESSQMPVGLPAKEPSLETFKAPRLIQDLRTATKLKKLLGDEVHPHLPTSVVRTKSKPHPVYRRRSHTTKPLPLLPPHHLHRSDTAVTMPELVHLGNRAMLGSYKPRDKLRRLDGRLRDR